MAVKFGNETVGRLYFKPGEEIPYKLIRFGEVVVQRADRLEPEKPMSLEDVADFRIVPEELVAKPTEKKTRTDKGGKHRKQTEAEDLAKRVLAGTPLAGEK